MIAALAGVALACAEKAPAAPDGGGGVAVAVPPAIGIPAAPPWTPSRLEVPDYVGAGACRDCHREQHAEWARSPHGRAMAAATPASVLGAFDGQAVEIPDGTATPVREGARYFIELEGAATERVEVARVIGSGRQHQVYLDVSHKMLPIIWVTVTRSWISASAYQHASADRASAEYWRTSDAIELGCFSCHLSQGRTRAGSFEWTDLPINCEACHGPGRAHVAERAPYGDLHAVSKEVDVAICAQCHARKNHFYLGRNEDGIPETPVATIALPAFRADGTQRVTGYQTAGHLLSRCFTEGAMACSSCHDPHAQTARDLTGESAVGKNSNKQCTVCHRNLISTTAAEKHQRHPVSQIFCVDCHMPYTWMFDDRSLVQRVSDHSVSVPRPAERIELGLPNACTTCHEQNSPAWAFTAVTAWRGKQANSSHAVRPWVRALHAAKTRDPNAAALLSEVAGSTAAPEFARVSALDALLEAPADPRWIAGVEAYLAAADANTRSIAYRVLMRHDHPHARAWRDRAIEDRSPLVRVEAALADTSSAGLSGAALESVIADLVVIDPLSPVSELQQLLRGRPVLDAPAELRSRDGRAPKP